MSTDNKPTIVLVHGAFADASGWSAVSRGLRERGYPVYAPANPLRGVAADGDYIRAFVATIDGPVVLVGHSYGGCVITNALSRIVFGSTASRRRGGCCLMSMSASFGSKTTLTSNG